MCQLSFFFAHCQWLKWNEGLFENNSYMYYTNITEGDGALKCISEESILSKHGFWNDGKGNIIKPADDGAGCLYVTREDNVSVSLNRRNDCIPPTSGLWKCATYTPKGKILGLYIYIANCNTFG